MRDTVFTVIEMLQALPVCAQIFLTLWWPIGLVSFPFLFSVMMYHPTSEYTYGEDLLASFLFTLLGPIAALIAWRLTKRFGYRGIMFPTFKSRLVHAWQRKLKLPRVQTTITDKLRGVRFKIGSLF